MQQQPNFDCDRVSKLVSDTICMLCKNSVKYQSELSIKGLIGVSIDASAMFMVQITETFSALTDEDEEQSHGGTCSEDARHPVKRHIESPSRSVQPPNKILALMRSTTTITTPERSLVPVQNSIRPVRTPQSLQKPPQTCNRNLMPRFPNARPRMMLAASRMMGQKRSMNSARIANPRMAMQQRGRLAAPRGGMVSRRPNMRGQMPAVRGRPTAGARGMQPRMMRNAIQMTSPRNQMQPRGIRNAIQMAPPRGNVPQSPRNQMQPRMIRNAIQMTPPSGNVPQSPQNQTRPRMVQKAIQMTPPSRQCTSISSEPNAAKNDTKCNSDDSTCRQ